MDLWTKTRIIMGPEDKRNQKETKWKNVTIKHGAHKPLKYPCVEKLYKRLYEIFDGQARHTIISEVGSLVQQLDDPEHVQQFCDEVPTFYRGQPFKKVLSEIHDVYKRITEKSDVGETDAYSNTIGASPDSYWKDAFAFKGMTRANTLRRCRRYETHTERVEHPECAEYLRHYHDKSLLHSIWHGGKRRKTRRR